MQYQSEQAIISDNTRSHHTPTNHHMLCPCYPSPLTHHITHHATPQHSAEYTDVGVGTLCHLSRPTYRTRTRVSPDFWASTPGTPLETI